jgi:hypothetical protein
MVNPFVRPLRSPCPGPHDKSADERSGGQGRPISGPPVGLVLDGHEHGGRLESAGAEAANALWARDYHAEPRTAAKNLPD